MLKPWDPVPEGSYHHLGLSPIRPNELWTCPSDGAAMAQAHGCQRNSCGSVRRGRGGDRYNQRLCVCERGSVCVCEKERENVPVCVRVCVCVCMHMCPCACMYARSYVYVGVGVGAKGEDPDTPGPARICPGTVTIPQYQLNKTK